MAFRSYTKGLTAILLLCFLIPFTVIFVININNAKVKSFGAVQEEANTILASVTDNMNNTVDATIRKVKFVNYYNTLNNLLSEGVLTDDINRIIETNGEITTVIDALLSDSVNAELTVYTTNQNIYSTGYIIKLSEEAASKFKVTDDDYSINWRITERDNIKYFTAYKKYRIRDDSYNIIEIKIPFSQFCGKIDLKSFKDSHMIYTHDGKDYLIGQKYAENEDEIIKEIKSSDSYIMFNTSLKSIDEKVAIYVDKSNISASLYKNILFVLVSMISIIGVVLILIFVISNRLSKNLVSIVESIDMHNIEEIENIQTKYREFETIRRYLIDKTNDIREESAKRVMLELELLHRNISPHFLYNSLSAIKNNCNDEKLKKIVDSMVEYYRSRFNRGQRTITVKNEFEGINEYMKLLQYSYDKSFEAVIRMSPQSSDIRIMTNILQPIVENAFMHGVNLLDDGEGIIILSSEVEGDKLIINVTDNACRFTEGFCSDDFIGEIMEKGHSLANIIKRIKLKYGEEYGIKIVSDKSKTQVSILLPAKGEE